MQRENIAHQQYSPFNQTEYKTTHFTPDSFPLRPRAGHFYVKPFPFRMPPCHDGTFTYRFAVAKQKN